MEYPEHYPWYTPSYGRKKMPDWEVATNLYIPYMPFGVVAKSPTPIEGDYAYWIECDECPNKCDSWAPFDPYVAPGQEYEYTCVEHGHKFTRVMLPGMVPK